MNIGSYQKVEIIFNVVLICIAVSLILDFKYESKLQKTELPIAVKQNIVELKNRSKIISSNSRNLRPVQNFDRGAARLNHRNIQPYKSGTYFKLGQNEVKTISDTKKDDKNLKFNVSDASIDSEKLTSEPLQNSYKNNFDGDDSECLEFLSSGSWSRYLSIEDYKSGLAHALHHPHTCAGAGGYIEGSKVSLLSV